MIGVGREEVNHLDLALLFESSSTFCCFLFACIIYPLTSCLMLSQTFKSGLPCSSRDLSTILSLSPLLVAPPLPPFSPSPASTERGQPLPTSHLLGRDSGVQALPLNPATAHTSLKEYTTSSTRPSSSSDPSIIHSTTPQAISPLFRGRSKSTLPMKHVLVKPTSTEPTLELSYAYASLC